MNQTVDLKYCYTSSISSESNNLVRRDSKLVSPSVYLNTFTFFLQVKVMVGYQLLLLSL